MIREIKPKELSLTREVAFAFFNESGLPGKFNFDHWVGQWTSIIDKNLGTIIAYFKDGEIRGLIGGLCCECTMTKDREAIEAFWYVLPDSRSGTAGIRLLQAFEAWAKSVGAVRLKMMHLSKLNPEVMEGIYKRMHYRKLETAYSKEL